MASGIAGYPTSPSEKKTFVSLPPPYELLWRPHELVLCPPPRADFGGRSIKIAQGGEEKDCMHFARNMVFFLEDLAPP